MLYTRYPIVARAKVQPLGRVRRASKGILHTKLDVILYIIKPVVVRAWPGLAIKSSARASKRYLAAHRKLLTTPNLRKRSNI